MTRISFPCDRCKTPIEGTHTPGATGGFYVVSEGWWAQFRRSDDEHFVCDTCVQSMPEYRAIYGPGPSAHGPGP